MGKFRTLCVPLGRHVSPDGSITVTPRRCRSWVSSFEQMRSRGIKIPICWGHNSHGTPFEDEDAYQLSLNKFNAGYLTGMEAGDDGLYISGEAPGIEVNPETGNLEHWVELPDGRKVKAAIGEVSAGVHSWRDGTGKHWPDSIIHVAATVLPVCAGQKGFERLSTLSGGFRALRNGSAPVPREGDGPVRLSTLSRGVQLAPGNIDCAALHLHIPKGEFLTAAEEDALFEAAEDGDRQAMLSLIRLGWRRAAQGEYRGKGTKWIGTGPDGGKVRYQANQPGLRAKAQATTAKQAAGWQALSHDEFHQKLQGHAKQVDSREMLRHGASVNRAYGALKRAHGHSEDAFVGRLKELAHEYHAAKDDPKAKLKLAGLGQMLDRWHREKAERPKTVKDNLFRLQETIGKRNLSDQDIDKHFAKLEPELSRLEPQEIGELAAKLGCRERSGNDAKRAAKSVLKALKMHRQARDSINLSTVEIEQDDDSPSLFDHADTLGETEHPHVNEFVSQAESLSDEDREAIAAHLERLADSGVEALSADGTPVSADAMRRAAALLRGDGHIWDAFEGEHAPGDEGAALLSLIRLAWIEDRKSGWRDPLGKRKRWKDTDTGAVRYQQSEPGSLAKRRAARQAHAATWMQHGSHEALHGALGEAHGGVKEFYNSERAARSAHSVLKRHHGTPEKLLERLKEKAGQYSFVLQDEQATPAQKEAARRMLAGLARIVKAEMEPKEVAPEPFDPDSDPEHQPPVKPGKEHVKTSSVFTLSKEQPDLITQYKAVEDLAATAKPSQVHDIPFSHLNEMGNEDGPFQEEINKAVAEHYRDNPGHAPAVVIREDGKDFILEGRHRALGAKMRGKDTVRAVVIEKGADGKPAIVEPKVEESAVAQPDAVAAPETPAEPDAGKRHDGRQIPKVGDEVSIMRGGFGGMPTAVRGQVVKGIVNGKSGLRVKITGGGDMLGIAAVGVGKTLPLDEEWTVKDDPEIKRRGEARKAAQEAKKAADEKQRAEHKAGVESAVSKAKDAGHKPLSEAKAGDMLALHDPDGTSHQVMVTSVSEHGPEVVDLDGDGNPYTIGTGDNATVAPATPESRAQAAKLLRQQAERARDNAKVSEEYGPEHVQRHTLEADEFERLAKEAEAEPEAPSVERHDAIHRELGALYKTPEYRQGDHATHEKVRKLEEELEHHKPAALAQAQADIDYDKASRDLTKTGRKEVWQRAGYAEPVAERMAKMLPPHLPPEEKAKFVAAATGTQTPEISPPEAGKPAETAVESSGTQGAEKPFDAEAFDRREDEIAGKVAESRKSGAIHLDEVSKAVETLRGKTVKSLRDGSTGTVVTAFNDGSVQVDWSDEQSAKSNNATQEEIKDGRKKKKVWRNHILPGDTHEFVVEGKAGESEAAPKKNRGKKALAPKDAEHVAEFTAQAQQMPPADRAHVAGHMEKLADQGVPALTASGEPVSEEAMREAARQMREPEGESVPAEAKPKEPGFTGTTVDSLGRTYHWVDGKRVKSAEEVAAAKSSPTMPESEGASHDNPTDERNPLLEGTGGAGEAGRVSDEELPGEDAGTAHAPVLPADVEGPGESGGVSGVPASPDARGANVRGGAAPGGNASTGGQGADGGAAVPEAAGRGGNEHWRPEPVKETIAGIHRDRDAGQFADLPEAEQPAPETPAEASLAKPPTPENPTDTSAGNFHYDTRNFAAGGLKAKFKLNLDAIRVYKAVKAEGRAATPEEQSIMSKYVGWGAFPALLNSAHDDERTWQERNEAKQTMTPEDYEEQFGYSKWDKERQQLQAVLTPEEWKSARKSSLNAHYTSPAVVDLHWQIAQRLGFDGGRFLETSAGIGYYLGMMPPELAGKTYSSAVEKEPVTGGMLEMLYPAAKVKVQGFEHHQAPDNFYDLVASNVPFGDYGVHDKRYNKHNANIHDYFFLKSADLAREGGLVMHITSTGTLDKGDPKIREELAKTCDFVAAVRFPSSTHKENAGTEVVTDMVILRKRPRGEEAVSLEVTPDEALPRGVSDFINNRPGARSGTGAHFTGVTTDSLGRVYHWVDGKRVPAPKWNETTTVPDPAGGEPIVVNRYFAERPDMMLGTLDRTGTMYGADQKFGGGKNVSKTDDYAERLAAAIETLPEGLLKKEAARKEGFVPERLPAPGDVEEGGFSIQGDKLFVREGGALVERECKPKDLERIKGMLGIRDAVREALNAQREGKDATKARVKLNKAYDAYVKKNGLLHSRENIRAFRGDPDSWSLLSLEHYNADEKKATKADVFTKDTTSPAKSVDRVETVAEGVGVVLNETGRLDVDRIAKLTGKTREQVEKEFVDSGLAFNDPGKGWTPANQYLSGNVRRKLVLARAAAESDPAFLPNVDALAKVQPEDIPAEEIVVRMGASWIAPNDIKAFAAGLLNGQPEHFEVEYNQHSGEWSAGYTGPGERALRNLRVTREAWGAKDAAGHTRVEFHKLLEAALSGKSVIVYDGEGDQKVMNEEATEAARARVEEMQERFGEWLWQDPERRKRVHRYYNDNFNNIRAIHYDGSHLTFPGMNPNIELRPHQKDFVWQIITTGKGLAGHEVGTGKCAPLDSNVLTPSGWKRMGDIKVGDEVIAGDGSRTQVTGVFPQGEKEIFRVVFSDGGSAETCDEHLWLTQTYRERSQAINAKRFAKSEWTCDKAKVRTLAEIRETLVSPHLGAKNHSIPLVGPVDFMPQPVPIGAYTLGVLLGDGSLKKTPTISNAREDVEIIEHVRQELPADLEIREFVSAGTRVVGTKKSGDVQYGCPAWGIVRRSPFVRYQKNQVYSALRDTGLVGCRAWEKFIPDVYKFNSPAVRLAVLQGLLDTDGTISSRKERSVTFYTTSDRLADDVVFLVRSFGGLVTRGIKHPSYTYKGEKKWGRPCHRLSIKLPPEVMPFRLKRKADLVVPKTKYRPVRYIVAVEPVGKKLAQCISVAHPSRLYVMDSLAVTHNTYTMIAAAMELRRMGLAKKPAIACLKANVEAITADALKLYPGAKILSTADMFDAKSRKKTMARIATGDYDMIIMTHDNMNMLKMRPKTEQGYIEQELEELRARKNEAKRDGNKNTMKDLEKAEENLVATLQKAIEGGLKDEGTYFEDTGIDHIFVDEAHKYKTLPVYTKADRVNGVPTGRSQRATNMMMRTRWLMENNGGRGVVFATGTPVANTMAELFTMQRYLQPEELKERGLQHFDAWANAFGKVVQNVEKTPMGTYKRVGRFAEFVNVPELMQIARQMLDVQRADHMKKDDGSPVIVRPKRKDSGDVVPQSPEMAAFVQTLVARAEKLKGQRPEKGADNMLVICTDGRKASLDMRLVDPGAKDDPGSKTNLCIQNILKLNKDRPGVAQLVFCDIGVNPIKEAKEDKGSDDDEGEDESDVGLGGFHYYEDIIQKLVKGGIPREKIANFAKLKGAEKEQAMDKLRKGEMSVAIGSTDKLGTGVNCQDKLAALHHLDAPWFPAAVEQRDGRGWRNGNRNDPSKPFDDQKIDIHRYLTKDSMDELFWQVLDTKSRFIKQVMTPGITTQRAIVDEDTETISFAQLRALATGNPLVMEKVKLDDEVKKLSSAEKRHNREKAQLEETVKSAEARLPQMQQRVEKLKQDAATIAANDVNGDKFTITIHGKQYTDKNAAVAQFSSILEKEQEKQVWDRRGNFEIGSYRGMKLMIQAGHPALVGPSGEWYECSDTFGGVEHMARRIATKDVKDAEDAIPAHRTDLERLKEGLNKQFTKKAELDQKRDRLKAVDTALSGKKEKDRAAVKEFINQASRLSDAEREAMAAHMEAMADEGRPAVTASGEELDQNDMRKIVDEVRRKSLASGKAAAQAEQYVSPKQRQAIHQGLKTLHAMNDDQAREINGAGFNKFDTDFGGKLAETPELSDRQAIVGAKILKKYKRQLGDELHRTATTFEENPVQPTEPGGEVDVETAGLDLPESETREPKQAPTIPQKQVTPKEVTVAGRKRYVHNFVPTPALEELAKSSRKPRWLSVGVNRLTHRPQASIWGVSAEEVQKFADELLHEHEIRLSTTITWIPPIERLAHALRAAGWRHV